MKLPRQRALGGVWIQADDFPHAFQHVIVYHNINRFANSEHYQDVWSEPEQPFIPNEKNIYVKMELDDEAFNAYKEQKGLPSEITLEDLQQKAEEEKTQQAEGALPGEIARKEWGPDQIFFSYAPYPTKQAYEVMPRSFMRLHSIDSKIVDRTLSKYHEAANVRLTAEESANRVIWLKPNFVAPMGFGLWLGSPIRKITIVPEQEYLVQQLAYTTKQYTIDFQPLQKGKNHCFTKYDFKVPEEDTKICVKISCPTDKYLADFLRLKIVDKSASKH